MPEAPTVRAHLARALAGGGRRLARPLLDFFFPDLCLACRRRPASATLSLCLRCRSRLRAATVSCCATCGRSLPAERGSLGRLRQCGGCLRRSPPWRRLVFLYDYSPPLDAVVHAFKFRQIEPLGAELARIAFDRHAELLAATDLVVPMPLPWTRRLVRGFNQAEAIAAPLADALGLPLAHALRRTPTPPHSLLPRQRRWRGVSSTFRLRRGRDFAGRKVLLVDDVFTSGATMRGASFVLRRAGAQVLVALVAGRTPGPGER